MQPYEKGVLAVGLSCLDMLLLGADDPATPESIAEFRATGYEAGGSAPNVSRAVAALGLIAGVRTVVGDDAQGKELRSQIASHNVNVDGVVVNKDMATALSVLPVFHEGRGCFVNLACNSEVTSEDLFPNLSEDEPEQLSDRIRTVIEGTYVVFHFGYPHLMRRLQGKELSVLLEAAQTAGGITSLDVNGANSSDPSILQPAMQCVGVFHANAEEAATICGVEPINLTMADIRHFSTTFLSWGAALVAITLGADGAFLATNADQQILGRGLGESGRLLRPGESLHALSFKSKGQVNATGAGDSFLGGLLSVLCKRPERLSTMADMGMASALFRIDSSLSPIPYKELRRWIESEDVQKLSATKFK